MSTESNKYEILVRELVFELYKNSNDPLREQTKIESGLSNKWLGVSGFKHQIDVSAANKSDVLLVECKSWSKQVDVPRFLTFVARIIEIREQEKKRLIHASLVTRIGFDSGTETLARHYGIKTDIVRSPSEFGLHYKDFGFIGVADSGSAAEEIAHNVSIGISDGGSGTD